MVVLMNTVLNQETHRGDDSERHTAKIVTE